MARMQSGLGNIVAPWRFLVFCLVAVAGTLVAWPAFGAARGVMVAFDIASITFMATCAPLFRYRPAQMRIAAQKNDANRGLLLLIASVVTGVILVAVGNELVSKGGGQPRHGLLLILTLALCWLFGSVVYSLHYAHLFYLQSEGGEDQGGLRFPGSDEPDYWDFAYFSTCLQMTFQTSDVEVTSGACRRIVMFQSLAAFVFNIGVIAFTINLLGSK